MELESRFSTDEIAEAVAVSPMRFPPTIRTRSLCSLASSPDLSSSLRTWCGR